MLQYIEKNPFFAFRISNVYVGYRTLNKLVATVWPGDCLLTALVKGLPTPDLPLALAPQLTLLTYLLPVWTPGVLGLPPTGTGALPLHALMPTCLPLAEAHMQPRRLLPTSPETVHQLWPRHIVHFSAFRGYNYNFSSEL